MRIQSFFKEYNFHPKKRWGQNFLIDENIRRNIIKAADLENNDTVVEIGPGFGALTEDLVKRVKRVIAVEKDNQLTKFLKERFKKFSNLEIVNEDILKFKFALENRCKVIGNLPYYITTPIIFHLFEQKKAIDFILITVQKELGERIIAKPATKDYGILSVKARFFSKPKVVFNISAKSFFPVPKVDSCLLKLDIYEKRRCVEDERLFFKIIEAGFSQRRKTILNCISDNLFLDKNLLKKMLKRADMDCRRRGETFSLKEFVNLSKKIKEDLCSSGKKI